MPLELVDGCGYDDGDDGAGVVLGEEVARLEVLKERWAGTLPVG